MFRKLIFSLFSILILCGSLFPTNIINAESLSVAETTNITSKMYGGQFEGTIMFDTEVCRQDFERLNNAYTETKIDAFKFDDDSSGFVGKFVNMINEAIFHLGAGFTNLLFGGACYLGFAPSQLLQLMFFPIVLDDFQFLDTMSTSVRTISIMTLLVVTVMAILELNKKQGTIAEEMISKAGSFILATGIIAFSKFILQGIYDVANILGYYVSKYQVSIAFSRGDDVVEHSVNVLNLPTVFISYLEFAFSPDVLNKIPSFNIQMVSIMIVVKIVVLLFMTKDLLKIAVFGIKRMITLISAAILVPILAALIPSYKTQDIFNKYFRSIVASAFTPVLFGMIYLASAPFVIEDLVGGMIEAPILKVLVLAFFLNIIASIPDFVNNLIGSSNTLGNPGFEKATTNFSPMGRLKSNYQGINKVARDQNLDFKQATKKYVANRLKYGSKR